MIKIIVEVEGMHCGMCETHVNDVVRRVGGVKKVTSSHSKGVTEVIAEDNADTEAIKAAVAAQGTASAKCRLSRMKSAESFLRHKK